MQTKPLLNEFTKGVFRENPIFVSMLGLCPALAVSDKVVNALGMGAGVFFVLVLSNIIISSLKSFIPDKVRIPVYIVIIASFVTIVDMLMQAYTPQLSKDLGVFVQLIVVNCVILGRAETYASKHSVIESVLDGLGMASGFTLGLSLIALFREVFGYGAFFTISIIPSPAAILSKPAGAMLVVGLLMAGINLVSSAIKKRSS